MDRKLRYEIAQVFAGESVRYHYEVMNEVWLTGAKLTEQIQFFSPSWPKRYGYLLTRERMVMVDEDGVEHKFGWCYPHRDRSLDSLRRSDHGPVTMIFF